MASPGALDDPLEIASNIVVFHCGIVQRGPQAVGRQQLLRAHSYLLNVVHSQPPGRIKVLPQAILLPGVYDFTIRFGSFRDRSPYCIFSRDHRSTGREKTPPPIDNSWDMALKKRKHIAEIGQDDVGASGKIHTMGKLFEEFDFGSTAIGCCNLARHLDNFSRLDGENPACAKLASQHGEDAGPRANFHDNGPLANSPSQRFRISFHADTIRNHRAVGSQAVHVDLPEDRGCVCRNGRHHSRLASPAIAPHNSRIADGSSGGRTRRTGIPEIMRLSTSNSVQRILRLRR